MDPQCPKIHGEPGLWIPSAPKSVEKGVQGSPKPKNPWSTWFRDPQNPWKSRFRDPTESSSSISLWLLWANPDPSKSRNASFQSWKNQNFGSEVDKPPEQQLHFLMAALGKPRSLKTPKCLILKLEKSEFWFSNGQKKPNPGLHLLMTALISLKTPKCLISKWEKSEFWV